MEANPHVAKTRSKTQKVLITSDLHLENKKDTRYRWDIFRKLKKHAKRPDISDVFVLGDVTDKKNRHDAKLVNSIVEHFEYLAEAGKPIHVLQGNHDYEDPKWAFLSFLDAIPGINFYTDPTPVRLENGGRVLFVPSGVPTFNSDWIEQLGVYDERFHLICMHHPVPGSILSNGQKLKLEKWEGDFYGDKSKSKKTPIISGDIHTPQRVGRVLYVGAPYPINFGDHWAPRMLTHDVLTNKSWNIPLATIHRANVDMYLQDDYRLERDIKPLPFDLNPGDHVKIKIHGKRHHLEHWDRIQANAREWAADVVRVKVFSIEFVLQEESQTDRRIEVSASKDPEEVWDDYADEKKLTPFLREKGRKALCS